MSKKYKLIFSMSYIRKTKKLIKLRRISEEKINSILLQLSQDPFHKSLMTHKVDAQIGLSQFSSRVDGDLRMIWNFSENRICILILDIGGHSGGTKVYK